MVRNAANKLGSATQLVGHLVRDGKKTGIAIALVTVMVVMWVRVLAGQKPSSAHATPVSLSKADTKGNESPAVRFVVLPNEPGRNDRIHRDFFTASDWSEFSSGPKTRDVAVVTDDKTRSTNRIEEVVARLAKTLELEAVLWSEHPQAFVNDRLVRVGDTLALRDGADFHPFEVVQIVKDAVHVRCGDRTYTLKLSPPTDVRK